MGVKTVVWALTGTLSVVGLRRHW